MQMDILQTRKSDGCNKASDIFMTRQPRSVVFALFPGHIYKNFFTSKLA